MSSGVVYLCKSRNMYKSTVHPNTDFWDAVLLQKIVAPKDMTFHEIMVPSKCVFWGNMLSYKSTSKIGCPDLIRTVEAYAVMSQAVMI